MSIKMMIIEGEDFKIFAFYTRDNMLNMYSEYDSKIRAVPFDLPHRFAKIGEFNQDPLPRPKEFEVGWRAGIYKKDKGTQRMQAYPDDIEDLGDIVGITDGGELYKKLQENELYKKFQENENI